MKNWKRGAAFLAALGLSLSLLGCGGSTGTASPPERQTPPPVEEKPEPVVVPEYEEPEPEPEPEPEKPPTGLVILKESYESNQKKYEIFCFNPDTKEETLISNFYIPFTDYMTEDFFLSSSQKETASRQDFSSDYTKMSDQKKFAANGEYHVGWQNSDGTFTDVTEALGQQSKSDFDSPVYYQQLGFEGDNFGFYYSSDGSLLKAVNYYVPIDNLSPSAVQEGDVHKAGHPYNDGGALLVDKYGRDKYYPSSVTDWIDDTHAIVNLRDGRNYDSLIVDTAAQTETAYIPGDSRNNWNGVCSPDGTRIAFLSEPRKGTGTHTDIYIIPTGGGDPVRVEGHSYDLEGASVENRLGKCNLIGWI